MNFIDVLMAEARPGNIHEVITEIAEIWNTVTHGLTVDTFACYPQHIRDLVYILHFDGVCTWDGLDDFVTNVDQTLFEDTIKAFENIGFEPVVKVLRAVLELEEVQAFYNNHIFFVKMATLQQIAMFERKLLQSNYNTSMWAMLERYILKAHLNTQNDIAHLL